MQQSDREINKCDHRVASQEMHLLAVSGFGTMHSEQIQLLDIVGGGSAPAAAQSKLFTAGVAAGLLVSEASEIESE